MDALLAEPAAATETRHGAAVRLVGVRRHYGDVAAVDGVDLEIARGESFTTLGPLDLKLRQEMQVELKRIQREMSDVGMTFVYVTHDQEEALTMSDRLAVFNAGRIEQVGTPAEVYEHPRTEFVAGFIGVSNVL